MEFLSANCFVFLTVAIVAAVYALINQVLRMKRMFSHGPEKGFDGFFQGIFLFAFSGLTAGICFLLFIVGIAIRLFA